MNTVTRRNFLHSSAAALTALTAAGAADRPNEKVILAFMGLRSRGKDLLRNFATFKDVEVAYLCDVDANMVPAATKVLADRKANSPRVETDVRRVLDDKKVTALVIAAPDHWHALATIWACQAGKHVYVEKPISHNLIEGRRMVEAVQKYGRIAQVGTQRRSAPHFHSAAQFIRSGGLGKIPFVRTSIAGNRSTIGHKADQPVPPGVNYELWLGPAPLRPFNPNRFHYNWHWHWDFGTGELGNNGIHAMDAVRMLLNLDAPHSISSTGGTYFYDDDRQAPDTQIVCFEFPQTTVVWEHRIWSKTGFEGASWSVVLYGEKGTMIFDRKGWHVRDGVQASDVETDMELPHIRNFLDSIKEHTRPNAPIDEGHKSTRLCHLGNIAFRIGRTLRFDAGTENLISDAEANALLGRTYRKGFEV